MAEIGIGEIRTKKTATGALVLEISCPEEYSRADALATKMSALFAKKQDVQIARPAKRADIGVRELDDSIAVGDVVSAVAATGGCGPREVKAGSIRSGSDRMETLWLQCPHAVAKKVVDGGRIQVGWSSVRVEAMTWCLLQFCRCLEWGHIRALCKIKVDRSGL
ncbi:uncharacterized protein LOC116846713 [Odontomachus brunneus]|uniref:uncharacterized protein LOC116846713 n=1 Tax=Odontomachus brunneus TaxID=486640 RepID=UPI0013F201DF|nr:uncharacterized protein LOC116846713 [Odontomachus brunneus]